MNAKPLLTIPGIVLLLLSHLPGTGAGLLRRAQELQLKASSQSLYRVLADLKKNGLIRFDGNAAGRRGGGRRYVLTEAGHEIASEYRRLIALAASSFPAEEPETHT